MMDVEEEVIDPDRIVRGSAIVEEEPTIPTQIEGKGSLQRAARKSADPMVILKGVTEAYTADEVKGLLKQAEQMARAQNSWEGLLAVVKLTLEYTVGKPVQRSVSAQISPSDFAKYFTDEEGEAMR